MGFQPTATTVTLTAKLTPIGKQLLLTNTNNLISKFALGDSDANYNAKNTLSSGRVPTMGGDVGVNNTISNSVGYDTVIKYPIFRNDLGGNLKSVDPSSVNVSNTTTNNGQKTITTNNITQLIVDRNDYNSDPNVNLFTSFGLPVTELEKRNISGTTFTNGGWADTALSGLASDKIVIISIDNSQFGETLDGKQIKLELPTTTTKYDIYSTFQYKGANNHREDVNYKDTAINTAGLGTSLAFLVCDDILRPNGGNPSKSWGTGFGDNKPFSLGGKEFYNLRTNTNISKTADTVVGVAYLDKGILVLTDPTIVKDFDPLTLRTSITYDSVSTNVVQNITCIAGRGEFGKSSNPTWSIGDSVRITEVGLYDDMNRLVAYGKFDRQIEKNVDGFISFGVKITL